METFNYKISLKKNLNEDERKVLLKLYQPILGVQATSIYFTLIEEKEVISKLANFVFNEKRLMKQLKLTNTKLMEGIHKLEGLKLLKRTYLKSKDVINFKIQPPLDSATFFENVLLNDLLKKALGDQDYEITRYCYFDEEIFEEDEKDLTVSFIEAFPEETNEITLKGINEGQEFNSITVSSDLIDFSKLELELIKNHISSSVLTKQIKKLILDNASFLNYDYDLIAEALINAYNQSSLDIDKNLLKVNLKTALSKSVQQTKTHAIDQMKDEFKEMEPTDYLASLTSKQTSLSFSSLINTLKNKYHLAKENINCLLNYSVLKNNGRIVERYILKIAETLNKLNIFKLEDVMEHLKTAHNYQVTKIEQQQLTDEQRFANIDNGTTPKTNLTKSELPEPNKYFIM